MIAGTITPEVAMRAVQEAVIRPADGNPVAERLAQLRGALLDSAALDSIPEPQPVIDGLLYRDGIAWLYGKPGTYKSIIALDWACCVSVGLPWQEHEAVQGPVLYVYVEGMPGLRQRVRAWEDRAGYKSEVIFLPTAVQLLNPVDLTAFKALVAEFGAVLVVIDTQARVTVGVEENSAMDMGKVVDAAGAIYRAARSCVLILHHEGRTGDNPRGSIAIEGAATSLFRTDFDGSRVKIENKRQRDAAEADDVILYPRPHLGSIVLTTSEYSDSSGRSISKLKASELEILRLLANEFSEYGTSASTLIKTSKLADSTVYASLNNLVRLGLILSTGTKIRSHYEMAPPGLLRLQSEYSDSPGRSTPNSGPPFRGPESSGVPEIGKAS